MKYYKPSWTEELIAWLIGALAGLIYLGKLSVVKGSETSAITVAVNLLVYFFMALILGYLVVVTIRESFVRPLMKTIAKYKTTELRIAVYEACGKKISEEEAVDLHNKVVYIASKKKRLRKKLEEISQE